MPKLIRVRDLPHSTLEIGVHLYCPMCGDTRSATAGDYFMAPLDLVMRCQNDKTPLRLTITRTTEEDVNR